MHATDPESSARTPAILCLAAGPSQIVVIEKARQLGYAVIAVDRNPQAPGFALCAGKIVASTYEAGPILDRLRPLLATYQLQGVVNRSSGLPVVTAAEIGQALGLPGPSPAGARTLTDKAQLMAACHEAGIPAPRCQTVADHDEIDHAQIEYPCVVKPAMSLVGKSGITVVRQAGDLAGACAAARAVSLNGKINLEEFLPGHDVSLTALIADGNIHQIVLKDELTTILSTGGIQFDGVAVPSRFSGTPIEAAIQQLARQVVDSFGLERSVLNLSCRCTDDGQPKLIEIHLDLGGDVFYEGLVPESTASDPLGLMIEFLTGRVTEFPPLEFKPTALVFDPATKQGTTRRYTILKASTRPDLERKIAPWLSS